MSTPVAGPLGTVPLHVAAGDIAVWWNDPGGTWESVPLGSGPAGPQGVPGPPGATGPAGATGATGPAGAANITGAVAGQLTIAGSATSITSSIPTGTFLTPGAAAAAYLPLSGGTLTGALVASAGISSTFYTVRPGTAGSFGTHGFNIDWTGSVANLWIDTLNLGAIAVGGPYLALSGGTLTGNLTINGTLTSSSGAITTDGAGSMAIGPSLVTGNGVSTGSAGIEVGGSRTGNGSANIDFHATPSTDFEFRVLRAAGVNGGASLVNIGSGGITFSSNATNAAFVGAGVTVGAPTGGDQGIGSLNAQQLLVNDVPVLTTAGGTLTGLLTVGGGIQSTYYNIRNGTTGSYGSHGFNIDWTGSAQLWIDTVNAGTITLTSDYRVKENVVPLSSMWERVKALNPISYTFKANVELLTRGGSDEHWGFLAHELQEALIPTAATGVKDAPNVIQSPNVLVLLAPMVKALQEAMARIEALEARL